MRNDSPRSMRNHSNSKHPFLRSLIATFLAASLMGEATHTEEHQSPHTNRRERIEEVRVRTTAVQHDSRSRDSMNGGNGGSDPKPRQTYKEQAEAIRRRPADTGATLPNMA